MSATGALWLSRFLGLAACLSVPATFAWSLLSWLALSSRLSITQDAEIEPIRFLMRIVLPALIFVVLLFLGWFKAKALSDKLNTEDWR